jgi:hypothetical protein
MMPGIGMLFGAIPIEDLMRRRNRFEELSAKQRISAQAVHAGLSMISAFLGMMLFGTFSAAAIGHDGIVQYIQSICSIQTFRNRSRIGSSTRSKSISHTALWIDVCHRLWRSW